MSTYALITGASSGIGRELAIGMARRGISLILVARRTAALDQLANELQADGNIQAHVLPMDLSLSDSARAVCAKCEEMGWEVEYLFNNAGFGDYGPFAVSNVDRIRQMMDLNMRTLTELTHAFLPGMLQRRKGYILQVASTAAFQPGPYLAVYSATKAFVLSFSEALAEELRGSGVHVTALCPGATRSEFSEAASMQNSRLFQAKGIPDASVVAEYGIKALLRNQVVAIHGVGNALMVEATRLTPRWMVRRVARMVLESR